MQWEGPIEQSAEGGSLEEGFLLSSYQYDLPPGQIAQKPLRNRDDSRLMLLGRRSGRTRHAVFRSLPDHLRPGDLLVVNNSKVFPARLLGRKPSGGKVEVLLLYPVGAVAGETDCPGARDRAGGEWFCLVRSSRRPRPGQTCRFPGGMQGTITGPGEGGAWKVRFDRVGSALFAYLDEHGRMPLPPYIRRDGGPGEDRLAEEDRARYQTVFARSTGSVAAPTAGLHFTPSVCERLAAKGIGMAEITLHVGPGTFLPVRVEDVRRHVVLPERWGLTEEAAEKVHRAKAEHGRVVAVGTTVVRCLETVAREGRGLVAGEGWTDLCVLPGHRFEVVDALITNFHLPGSSLLLLVSAFAGRDRVLRAYGEAIREGYRFYSYGDCMLIQ